ncbi:AAA family ATPase [Corallococcus sp. AS-1-12]|uniref:AAA family ATPase n=1 Tax=Corallococcus sp. AS-1-12 TaxID=2874598 RepID=UPI001CBEDB6A|nr:ATP-binding protein [Corallococcus sp. AS-1-12]MBZ4334786.1 ATP-binding protein [Corallococcus sp. AS-1-12]
MIESITLANFKSFGEEQTIPLEPITVLVGPNNSGKSNFMSVARFLGNVALTDVSVAAQQEGKFLLHAPPSGDGTCSIGWKTPESQYSFQLSPSISVLSEYATDPDGVPFSLAYGKVFVRGREHSGYLHKGGLAIHEMRSWNPPFHLFKTPWKSFSNTKSVKLSLTALRGDAEVIPNPEIGLDGRGLAAVLGLWRGAEPEKVNALNGFLTRCLPELKDVLVRPAPVPGHQRLWFRQKDGLEFDAEHVSDGVLAFTALAMHALSSESGQLLCIEEPEQSIHPKRLRELVDLLKDLVRERGCQFIIATHSTVLLNVFRDELEAILLFRRTDKGTRVKRLSDVPELVEDLQKTPPGDLLETGAFSTAF